RRCRLRRRHLGGLVTITNREISHDLAIGGAEKNHSSPSKLRLRRLTLMMHRLGWAVDGKRVRHWMHELAVRGALPARRQRQENPSPPSVPERSKNLELVNT